MLNENDFPGTQAENFVLRWMYRSPQTPVWGLAKRTENKRNKADHGPIEYCGRSDWSALIHRKDSAMTTATPTTPLSVNTWAISAAVKHTSSAPRGRGAAEFHVGNQCSRETHIVSTTWAWCR